MKLACVTMKKAGTGVKRHAVLTSSSYSETTLKTDVSQLLRS